MLNRSAAWGLTFALIFVITSTVAGYFAWQSQQNEPAQPAGLLAADKGYGVTLDLTRYDDEILPETLSTLRANGLLWLRQPIVWAELEPEPGRFNWQSLDRVFAAIAQHNQQAANSVPQDFKLIAVLQTTPAWARPSHATLTSPPAEISHFGQFARAFATRYGRQLDYYQIWHEPNLSAGWGQSYVDPAGYARLLQEAALNIREADPTALILTAALAPTLEKHALNLDETVYLDQLYQLKTEDWFDIVAGQPYGFDIDPAEPAHPDRLNFRRLELLHQVMLNHGDGETPIWATGFGWNALPPDWAGRPSPWRRDQTRYDSLDLQIQRTAAGLTLARRSWPWLGPMLAIQWDRINLAPDDPATGFALFDHPAMLQVIEQAAARRLIATPGTYPATHPSGRYSPGWRFGLTEADIPRQPPQSLTISFEGTRLDLRVNRGSYRGFLWVTIDDQPALSLPQNNQGHSYIVLYDPLRGSESITLAQYLSPGPHTALIEAEGGWGQWAVAGWTVYDEPTIPLSRNGWLLIMLLAVLSGLGLAWQLAPSLVVLTKLTWPQSRIWAGRYLSLPDHIQVIVIFTLAFGFYLAPGWLALSLLLPLTLCLFLRPDLGLTLVAFSLSFFLISKPLPVGVFLPLESTLILTTLGFCLKQLSINNYQLTIINYQSPISNLQSPKLKSADWAALALAGLALLSTLAAPNFGVSMYEWRMLVAESVLFYFLVRLGQDYGPPEPATPLRWAWRLVDAFIAGAVVHAAMALYLYFLTDQAILAEGVRRAIGPIYSSPNNLSLFLGRVWPVLLALAFLPAQTTIQWARLRRWLYGVGLLIVSLALWLTFSKGVLLLGLPGGLLVMAVFYLWNRRPQRRRAIAMMIGWLIINLAALIPLSQTERFQTTFNFEQGSTGFFRLKVWQAALTMLQEHWWLGVGLNNFLYQYRTRYILPEAWQEPNLSHPHNVVLDFGTRLGLGGVLLLLWVQTAFWFNGWKLYQRLPEPLVLGLLGSMAVFLSHGLVDNSYFLVDLAFTFFLTTAIIQKLAENYSSP
jgi:O-antigen ligase